MDFISVAYLGFLGILIILYYVIPKNRQWVLSNYHLFVCLVFFRIEKVAFWDNGHECADPFGA